MAGKLASKVSKKSKSEEEVRKAIDSFEDFAVSIEFWVRRNWQLEINPHCPYSISQVKDLWEKQVKKNKKS